MRHKKHRHQLGVKKEHRQALMGNLAVALITHGRIQTTLAKAKALRPFIEKIVTLAKNAAATEDAGKKLHFRRLAIARVRNKDAVKKLFEEMVGEFANRTGGYTRIYKLIPRIGDAADVALIEFIPGDDEGYAKKSKAGSAKKAKAAAAAAPAATAAATETVEAPAEEAPAAEEEAVSSDAPADEEKKES